MNCARFGTGLKIDIRIALSSLGRDPYIKLDRLSIAELKNMLASLRTEQRTVGGILKETAFNRNGDAVRVTIPKE